MPVRCGALLHAGSFRVVAEEIDNRAGDRLWIAPSNEDPTPIGKELASVTIGRRDDGLAGADRVRQRSGSDLLRVEVRRDVDVRGRQELGEFAWADEAVVENQARVDAQPMGSIL